MSIDVTNKGHENEQMIPVRILAASSTSACKFSPVAGFYKVTTSALKHLRKLNMMAETRYPVKTKTSILIQS